jgi:hypothetical protein
MSKYFTSVLKLVDSSAQEKGEEAIPLQVDVEASKLSVQLPSFRPALAHSHPVPSPFCSLPQACKCEQPRPPNKLVGLSFDKILPPDVTGLELYKHTAKDVVENALLGYHGTIITLGCTKTKEEQSSFTWHHTDGIVQRATKHIIRCLKKSKSSSTTSLVILCSFVMVAEEEVWDLLCGYSRGGDNPSNHPPKLAAKKLSSASQHTVTASAEVASILQHGRSTEQILLKNAVKPTKRTATPTLQHFHHTIFTLTVEFTQFGSINAPISGNLQFADLAVADPLTTRQRFTHGEKVDDVMLSLFSFADVVESLSSDVAVLDSTIMADSAFNQELEAAMLLHTPMAPKTKLHGKSVLTQLLQESLGGNCKTLLVSFAPMQIPVSVHSEVLLSLKLGSRARVIQNTPNKRDLAEKALMSAYLRGLKEVYGEALRGKQEAEQEG